MLGAHETFYAANVMTWMNSLFVLGVFGSSEGQDPKETSQRVRPQREKVDEGISRSPVAKPAKLR